jgi:hypothetical protein
MINKNMIEEDTYINSIRKHLQIIGDIFFNHDGCSEKQLCSKSKAELIESIDSLEKGKDYLPYSYSQAIDYIIREVRHRLSHITIS